MPRATGSALDQGVLTVSEKLRVLHVIADLDPRSGGTSRAVVDLAGALAKEPGLEVTVMFQSRSGQEHLPTDPSVRRMPVMVDSPWARISGWLVRKVLISEIKRARPDVIHVHGLWQPLCHWAASLATQHGIPLVVQPHGMLEPWALNHKAWRKRISLMLYQRRDLKIAAALVASTEREMDSFRKLGLSNDVAVIPHGIHVDNATDSAADRTEETKRLRKILFLSRLHPVKGLSTLLRAWSQVDRAGWQLIVAGPDEGGYLRQMRDLAGELRLADDISFAGEVQGQVKASAYRSADLFVLPTQSENFGIVIAEALSYGVPVITTRAAPWGALETHRCGWWIDQGVEPMARTLSVAMALSDIERRAMGRRGRELVHRYRWEVVAARAAILYRKCAGLAIVPGGAEWIQ